MSIFPKRTVAGSNVTIHWNLNARHWVDEHICPYVRIGVVDPLGKTTMLFEEYVPVLPSIGSAVPANVLDGKSLIYLNKNTPLLLLADYLSGRQKREKLIEILQNLQSGRHYYFTYPVAHDALPGKYKLLSEIYINGETKYSGTASEDFFYVEKITVEKIDFSDPSAGAVITNHSTEPTPVKILSYQSGIKTSLEDIQVFEMKAQESMHIELIGKKKFLCYNEERVIIPMYEPTAIRCIRNQQLLAFNKKEGGEEEIYIMHKEEDISYQLKGITKDIWEKADGLTAIKCIKDEISQEAYEEMLTNRLIFEIHP